MGNILSRVVELARNENLTIGALERNIGASKGVLSRAIARGTDIQSKWIQAIVENYPNYSAQWLLAGRGNMFHDQIIRHTPTTFSEQPQGTPYYDVDFCGGFDLVLNDQTYLPAGYINLPQYDKVDSWANITGHSMEPLISNGDIIALRKIEDWQTYLLYGEIYGIMTDEWRTVKRVRKARNPECILLEPINKEYDEQEIPKSIIRGVWQVLGSVKKFF